MNVAETSIFVVLLVENVMLFQYVLLFWYVLVIKEAPLLRTCYCSGFYLLVLLFEHQLLMNVLLGYC